MREPQGQPKKEETKVARAEAVKEVVQIVLSKPLGDEEARKGDEADSILVIHTGGAGSKSLPMEKIHNKVQ